MRVIRGKVGKSVVMAEEIQNIQDVEDILVVAVKNIFHTVPSVDNEVFAILIEEDSIAEYFSQHNFLSDLAKFRHVFLYLNVSEEEIVTFKNIESVLGNSMTLTVKNEDERATVEYV